jgi:hypothetical protein
MTDRPWDEARVLDLHRQKTAALIASSDPDLAMINLHSAGRIIPPRAFF